MFVRKRPRWWRLDPDSARTKGSRLFSSTIKTRPRRWPTHSRTLRMEWGSHAVCRTNRLFGCDSSIPIQIPVHRANRDLLIVAVGLRGAVVRRREETEKTVRLAAYAGGEVQPIAGSGGVVVAKAQRPKPVVLERMSVCVAEEAIEVPAVDVINGDLPAAGIADQQVVAEEAEVWRRKGHSPGRIQPRTVLQSLQQLALG